MEECKTNTDNISSISDHYKCHDTFKRQQILKTLFFAYISTLSLKRDKLSYYYFMRCVEFIKNIDKTNAIDALHFVTVLPHFLNECQKKHLQPLIDAIDNIYYVTFYKNSLSRNNDTIKNLRDEITLKDRALKGVFGSVQALKLEVGSMNRDVAEIPLKTLTGTGHGLTIAIINKKLEIIKNGMNYQKYDVVYTTHFGGCGLFFTIAMIGAQDAAFQVDIDPVFAGLPIYVICYNYNARVTLNYDLELLELIKYESCKYSNDFIVKKYIISHQKNKLLNC